MKRNEHPGKFIAIEGIDGSGQSTQTELLSEFLRGEGVDVLMTKEPTEVSDAAKRIKRLILGEEEADPKEMQELFCQDREYHLNEVVYPALEVGRWVVTDRYVYSTIAYGSAFGVDSDWLVNRNGDFIEPDMAFFLKVSPEVSVKRIHERDQGVHYFEKIDKLIKIDRAYMNVIREHGLVIIDGERSIDEVSNDIIERVKELL